MKVYICTLFTVALSRLDFNSAACNNYLKKFGTSNPVNGVGPTSLAYTGDSAFVTGTANVQVNLRYSDSLFNDATYFGLTQEDGKTADATCLDLKLWKFSFSNFSDPVQVTDLPLTASSNLNKKWRYLSFTIIGSDLATRLVQTSNSEQYLFYGFYAIAYYAAETAQVQYTYYFQFVVIVNKSTGQIISTAFHPFNQYETVGCSPSQACYPTQSTKIEWCTDATCAQQTIPSLFLNDQFYIQQVVTTTGLTDYYLTNSTVYYIGNGLNINTIPVYINNSVPGKVIFLLTADIAWQHVVIQVTSYLSTTITGERRFLQETDGATYDPVSGQSVILTCIKLSQASEECVTCVEECTANGFAASSCSSCYVGYDECCFQVLAVAISTLMLFIL